MRSWKTILACFVLALAVGCKMQVPETDQWVRARPLEMIQENAARAARTGLVTVMETAHYRVESVPMYRGDSLQRMAVVTWSYSKHPGEGKPVYAPLGDSQGDGHSPHVDWLSSSFAPGLAEQVLSGQSVWTHAGDIDVRTQATPGPEWHPVYLFEKKSPAGHESFLKHTFVR